MIRNFVGRRDMDFWRWHHAERSRHLLRAFYPRRARMDRR